MSLFLFLFIFGCLGTKMVSTVRLVNLQIPSHVLKGSEVRLDVHFDLEGESLYSVKWFKDNREFYRFLPEENPPAQAFKNHGFQINLGNSSDSVVYLFDFDFSGSGIYRVEISGEAPRFNTVAQSAQLIVVEIPRGGPSIEGGKFKYSLGETLRVNCTSAPAKPATNLAWFINGDPVDDSHLINYPIQKAPNNFEISTLGLEFRVGREHFGDETGLAGDLKLKCLSTLGNVYWRSNEENFSNKYNKRKSVISRDTYSEALSTSNELNSKLSLKLFILLQSILVYFSHNLKLIKI